MKTKLGAIALTLSTALATLTGCSMTDTTSSDDIPSSGISTSSDAAEDTKQASSELYNLIGLEGKASNTGPGVKECGKKDPEKYFQIFHSWSFTPSSLQQLEGTMERLKAELPKHGWKVVDYGPDSSRNKNLSLTADNDTKKFSVNLTYQAKDKPPNLNFFVVSGCYQIPDGQKIEQF
ncbi:hypothetical protein [Streptomyces sp. yr375]|uniref:hypothetical protein n=1 Tax=Streptomyces sp. yr375 TaxID=1761906 RepID=UPI0015A661A9|nr:hypothetical protein [Streptomyces sp. yr375]